MRKRYRYDVRAFRIEDGGYHECSGQVIAVLQSSYHPDRKIWYLTTLVRKDEEVESLSPGEEVFRAEEA